MGLNQEKRGLKKTGLTISREAFTMTQIANQLCDTRQLKQGLSLAIQKQLDLSFSQTTPCQVPEHQIPSQFVWILLGGSSHES